MADLLDFMAPYPRSPGFIDRDTSRAAAESLAAGAPLIRQQCLNLINKCGSLGITPDEAAKALGMTVLSIRPRFTELKELGLIVDSGKRRSNDSGRKAKVMVGKWFAPKEDDNGNC